MIYLDDAQILWRGKRWCHLFSDESVDELETFARVIGLSPDWFQNTRHPHYDVTGMMIKRAVDSGATRIEWNDKRVMGLLKKVALYKRNQSVNAPQ